MKQEQDAEKSSNEDSIYRENILDHFRNPRNYGKLGEPDAFSHMDNPLCGDEIEIGLQIQDGKIKDARFMGRGCAISQASASMLAEKIVGLGIEEANRLTGDDIMKMLGVKVSPARMNCALLSLRTLKAALKHYHHAKGSAKSNG